MKIKILGKTFKNGDLVQVEHYSGKDENLLIGRSSGKVSGFSSCKDGEGFLYLEFGNGYAEVIPVVKILRIAKFDLRLE